MAGEAEAAGMIPRDLALRAAEMLEWEAAALKLGHTRNGEWSNEDAPVEADYHEMMSVALELRRHAGE